MWLILAILFLFSIGNYVLNLSLIKNKIYLFLNILFVSFLIFLLQIPAAGVNSVKLSGFLANYEIMASIAAYQIAESMLRFVSSMQLLDTEKKGILNGVSKYFSLTPPLVFLTGLYLIEIYLFNNFHGYSFLLIASVYSVSILFITLLLYYLHRKILANWFLRAEISVMITLFQIALAMFLPVLLLGIEIGGENAEYDYGNILISFIVMIIIIALGIINHHYKIGARLWKRLTIFFT